MAPPRTSADQSRPNPTFYLRDSLTLTPPSLSPSLPSSLFLSRCLPNRNLDADADADAKNNLFRLQSQKVAAISSIESFCAICISKLVAPTENGEMNLLSLSPAQSETGDSRRDGQRLKTKLLGSVNAFDPQLSVVHSVEAQREIASLISANFT